MRVREALLARFSLPAIQELRTLALFPALISFLMLWPALLNLGAFAPTDIVTSDPLTGSFTPGERRPVAENPLLGDVVDSFVPWKLYARSEIEAGRFPLWNPYNLLGTHFQANLQSGFFSPTNLLWLLLPPVWGLGAVTFIKWTLGGLGMALLLRRLGLGVVPAQFGSVAFILSGPVVGWLQWPIADALIWVPGIMWSALGWIETRRLGWLAALTFFIAAELTASHIETTFHSLLFAGAFALAAWLGKHQAPDNNTLPATRYPLLLGLITSAILGLLLSAVQVLPFLGVLTDSFQWAVRTGVSTQDISMPAPAALMWLSPNGWGWPDAFLHPETSWVEGNPYVGALTLVLAGWMLVVWVFGDRGSGVGDRGPDRSLWAKLRGAIHPRGPLFWALVAVVSASMAYGIPPLSYLRALPGFNTSLNSRLISVTGPCLIVLAAMGLERLLRTRGPILATRYRLPAFAVGAFAIAGVPFFLGGLGVWWVESVEKNDFVEVWRMWGVALFCAGAVLVLSRLLGWVGPRRFAALAMGLLLLDMVKAGWNFNPTADFSTFYPRNALTDFLASGGPTERVAVVGPYAPANTLLAYRIPDYRSYDATHPNRAVRFTRMMSPESFRIRVLDYQIHLNLIEPSAALMAAVGIKRVAVPVNELPERWQEPPPGEPVYTYEMTSHDFWVWRNNYARPYTYLAPRFQVASDEETLARRMRALTLDRVDEAQVYDPRGAFASDVQGTHTGAPISEAEAASVKLERYAPGDIEVRANTERKRLLVVNEQHTDDWRVTIDDQPAPLLRVNYLVQGVVLPPGEHRVRFQYDPPAFRWGVGLSLAGLAGWLCLIGLAVIHNFRSKDREVRQDS